MSGAWRIVLRTLAGLGVLATLPVEAQTPGRYPSPDGRAIATVSLARGTRIGEGELQVSDVSGIFRMKRSFASTDGEHGMIIVRAAWSPDSGFFVFSGESSGGHQPWHFPTFIYGRAANAIYQLDSCVSDIAVVDADFSVSAPHFIRVTVAAFSAGRGLEEHSRYENYNLAEVVQKCRQK
jgi:hypothetical protein